MRMRGNYVALTLEIPKEFYDELNFLVRKTYVDTMEKASKDVIGMKKFLSINEIISHYLDITRPTIMSWVRKGLPTYEIDGKKYIKRIELDEFIEKHKK